MKSFTIIARQSSIDSSARQGFERGIMPSADPVRINELLELLNQRKINLFSAKIYPATLREFREVFAKVILKKASYWDLEAYDYFVKHLGYDPQKITEDSAYKGHRIMNRTNAHGTNRLRIKKYHLK